MTKFDGEFFPNFLHRRETIHHENVINSFKLVPDVERAKKLKLFSRAPTENRMSEIN